MIDELCVASTLCIHRVYFELLINGFGVRKCISNILYARIILYNAILYNLTTYFRFIRIFI